jgi:hypothetical protein
MTDMPNPLDDPLVKQNICLDDLSPVLLARPYFRVQQNLNTRETSAYMTPAIERRDNHRGFGSGLEPIRRASSVEVGRRTGSDSQRTTTVKRGGNVGWYLLLAIRVQWVVVMKDRNCADTSQK